jgi:nitroimidazol reductase NimA-like FMN-containing flavoprotein (pyridoxamine 5'-phosphate oxidase superfamily)
MLTDPKNLRELTTEESLRRLAKVPVGRIVFTHLALPAIRPVNHLVLDGDIILRCHEGAAMLSAVGQVVAYEADEIDSRSQIAWTVIATGRATRVDDPTELAEVADLLHPWVDRPMTEVIRIHPELLTGLELVDGQVTGDDAEAVADLEV